MASSGNCSKLVTWRLIVARGIVVIPPSDYYVFMKLNGDSTKEKLMLHFTL